MSDSRKDNYTREVIGGILWIIVIFLFIRIEGASIVGNMFSEARVEQTRESGEPADGSVSREWSNKNGEEEISNKGEDAEIQAEGGLQEALPSRSELDNSDLNHEVAKEDSNARPAEERTPPADAANSAPRQITFPTEIRKWRSEDGRDFEGRVLKVNYVTRTVTVELIGGEEMRGVPLEKFSDEDQKLLEGE